ncbi:NAD(P)/FAD-dependent oxidoreductase [Granulicella cerasi]|uniref:NAD(P)/FAD-dependent oxidoreductase n=1 Tax=Granulicella cerasi TaxID=741063 RepID=A0ABW1ZCY3_9BACT|nr:NAD(P)/FAD-dependent oxidoreductase [Granulicella cerasi]
MKPGQKSVVIVGAGFAGLNCAQRLAANPEIHITLLDRNNYQQFQPLLYQVASGMLSADNAAFNLRTVLAEHDNVDIVMAEVSSVDLANRTAYSAEGKTYTGDFLVLAAGAEPNFFGIPGVQEHAFPLYSLLDAERLRSRILALLEAADRESAKRNVPLEFVVIGGGPTGVEIAGAIGDVFQRTSSQAFKHLDLKSASITLVDMAKTVLTPFGTHSKEYAEEALKSRSVKLMLGVTVSEVTREGVKFADGTHLPAQLVVWAGGLKASGLSTSVGIKTGRGGRIDVQSDLSVAGFPGVYALGDFANFKSADGTALPQLASVAQQAGRHCAKNIAAVVGGDETHPFEYFDKGIMAMVGRNAAVAEVGVGRHAITGILAFAAWLGVHAALLTTVRAQVETFLEWAWEYFGDVHVDALLDRPGLNWSHGKTPTNSK